MRRSLAALLIAIASGCGPKSSPGPTALFLKTGEVPGWSRKGEPRTFEAAALWQYVDGDAERYVQAGVERTFTADYRHLERADAVVDIYVMRNAEGARRILEAESASGSRPLPLGEEGRLYEASLTFRQGRYFVRLVAYEEASQVSQALVELARAIEGKLR